MWNVHGIYCCVTDTHAHISSGRKPVLPSGAWPTLLTKSQLCCYVEMSVSTLERVCPVRPVALGARILRWRRDDIDAWIASLPVRVRQLGDGRPEQIHPSQIGAEERRFIAVERAKEKARAIRPPRHQHA